MSNAKLLKKSEEKELGRVFKKQKVRLYQIKHFIFDFGGVLIEKSFVLKNLFSIFEHDLKFSLPDKELDPFIKKCRRMLSSGRISSREFLEKILDKYYYPIQDKKGALPAKQVNIEYYLELWFNLYTQVTDISSDMAEIVERLHQAGFTVSLMSNTYAIHVKSNRLRGFYNIFDNVFLSNEIGLIKPDIEKYKYLLNKLDTKPKKCVFIDDKIVNLVPARELGIIVIKFESFEKFKHDLSSLGIERISPNLRKELKEKYKGYKKKKKEYKKAKKNYKKAKKEYLKKKHNKKKNQKKKKEYQAKRDDYERKKEEYEKQKEIKKGLITEFRIE
ncbi:MAG: HAD family hydrolase [Candidatus Thorarchaeota archaeon]